MKVAQLLLFLSFTTSAFALTETGHIISVEANQNVDGTVTVKSPKLLRGRHEFILGSSNTGPSICRAMGFQHFLSYSKFSEYNTNASKAYLNEDGSFNRLSNEANYAINEVTCYNGSYRDLIQVESYTQNPDNSVTVLGPKLVRGARVYPLGSGTTGEAICKVLGLGSFLSQTKYTSYNTSSGKGYLNADGSFKQIGNEVNYSITEASCHDHRLAVVIQDQNGRLFITRGK